MHVQYLGELEMWSTFTSKFQKQYDIRLQETVLEPAQEDAHLQEEATKANEISDDARRTKANEISDEEDEGESDEEDPSPGDKIKFWLNKIWCRIIFWVQTSSLVWFLFKPVLFGVWGLEHNGDKSSFDAVLHSLGWVANGAFRVLVFVTYVHARYEINK